ncbi:hypothetical protein RYZ27_09220 [Hyphomonas sp. FCG-A18]|uniref:hypothetical protein n=1 Tax=Hyphomonas sp. FCG-A18 TaxID=3080019 RepID=UPI002B2A1FA6|nr:hypothetical protein RYZ27_09220 [Hyphomonas sp. FCG-A18]
MYRKTGITLAALAMIGGSAFADEVWSTEIGDVVYEADLPNGQAVWSYPLESEEGWRGKAFLPGLAGVYTGRTTYHGYWVEPGSVDGESGCAVEVSDPQTGESSDVWGRVTLSFVDPDFPGTWVALRGDCFEEPHAMLVGRPITAED